MLFVDAAEGNEQDMNGYEIIKRKSFAMHTKRSPIFHESVKGWPGLAMLVKKRRA